MSTEYKFDDLSLGQQDQAKIRFVNAGISDGYWYLVTDDGIVLSRNRIKQNGDYNE